MVQGDRYSKLVETNEALVVGVFVRVRVIGSVLSARGKAGSVRRLLKDYTVRNSHTYIQWRPVGHPVSSEAKSSCS